MDFAVFDFVRVDVPETEGAALVAPMHLQHLIEVAVEDFALPAHVDGVPAHQAIHGARVEGVVQEEHVVAELVVVF